MTITVLLAMIREAAELQGNPDSDDQRFINPEYARGQAELITTMLRNIGGDEGEALARITGLGDDQHSWVVASIEHAREVVG